MLAEECYSASSVEIERARSVPNQLSFAYGPLPGRRPGSGAVLAVTPCIDGVPLTELVAAFEAEQAFGDPVGSYGGLVPEFCRYGPLGDYFLGQGEDVGLGDRVGEIAVLACRCGEVGCWPLLTSVVVDDRRVRWEAFRQPFRPDRDYSGLGPFVFDRGEYEATVSELERRLAGLWE